MGTFRKTLVLCQFDWIRRERNSTLSGTEGVMIEVEYEDQVLEAFEAAMQERKRHMLLPPFSDYTLTSYLTPLGSKFYK